MQRMSKSVMLVWLVVFCLIVLAACGQPSAPESTEETNSEQGTEDPQADAEKGENVTQSPDAVESADGPVLQSVNIYHLGIQTPLSPEDETATRFAETVEELCQQAKTQENAVTGMRVTAEHALQAGIALEIVYLQPDGTEDWMLFVPMFDDGNNVWENVVYAGNPTDADDDGGLKEMLPLNVVEDGADFSEELSAYALDNLEQALFEGDTVDVCGMTAPYDAEASAEIADPLRSQLLYRAFAFYQNTCNQNFLAMHAFTAGELYETLHASAMFSQFDEDGIFAFPGLEEIADRLRGETLRKVTINKTDSGYCVRLDVEIGDVLTIDFVLEESGLPLVEMFDFSMV